MKTLKAEEAMLAPFEPVNPCLNFETRACVHINKEQTFMVYRAKPCKKVCTRFPNQPLGGYR